MHFLLFPHSFLGFPSHNFIFTIRFPNFSNLNNFIKPLCFHFLFFYFVSIDLTIKPRVVVSSSSSSPSSLVAHIKPRRSGEFIKLVSSSPSSWLVSNARYNDVWFILVCYCVMRTNCSMKILSVIDCCFCR